MRHHTVRMIAIAALASTALLALAQSAQAVVKAVGARPAVICASWERNSRSKSWGFGAPLRLVAIVLVSGWGCCRHAVHAGHTGPARWQSVRPVRASQRRPKARR